MTLSKTPYCKYDPAAEFEYAIGCLRVYLPTNRGFVNYNIIHSVREAITSDIWRLGQAFGYDNELSGEYPLTPFGAEWDMAVMLEGRDDFIGGSNHGDEIFTSFELWIDGIACEVTKLTELTPFTELKVTVKSIGYDPDDHVTKSLLHTKEFTITKTGVTDRQTVEWLNNYTMGLSYLAMMPPIKKLTDSYFTDKAQEPKKITGEVLEFGAKSATVFGEESGVSFTMSISEYPNLKCSDRFFITDNSGGAYNKMYFLACKGAEVKKGDVWHSTTSYIITVK